VEGSNYRVLPEQPGGELDIDGSIAAISHRMADASQEPVTLPTKLSQPHLNEADLKGIDGEVSHFRTHYSETGNRAKNIQVACRHINGTVLKPGDIFSYNQVVGPRDTDSGFHMAPVIIKGKLQPGMGGGVCQVSSTLYNAVLLADLKIAHREHHAFPVHYLPAGRDATVAYGDKDFQFQNNTDGVIAIAASGADGQVSMRIFGRRVPNREVIIERTNLSTWGPGREIVKDSSKPKGYQDVLETGHAGHRVTVWRIVKIAGHEVRREMVSRDFYQTFPRIIAVGTREVEPRPAPPTQEKPAPTGATTQSPQSVDIRVPTARP
jgi:vancomycin resistance protein YoaR